MSSRQTFQLFFGNMQGVISYMFLPLISLYVYNQEVDVLRNKWFYETFQAFYLDIKVDKKEYMIAKFLYLARRGAFLCVVLYINDFTVFQVQ